MVELPSFNLESHEVLVGFDGFVDHIYQVVDKREGKDAFSAMKNPKELAKRIGDSEGKSVNIELIPLQTKVGGNAPLFAEGLAALGGSLSFIGTIGQKKPSAIFSDFAKKCTRIKSLCPPGETHALEFPSGKVMLGVMGPLLELNAEEVFKIVKKELNKASCLVCSNWTMLPFMNDFWECLAKAPPKKRMPLFIDLCDPGKRKREDLKRALSLLTELQQHFDVLLSLNISEAEQVLETANCQFPCDPKEVCFEVKNILNVSQVILHNRQFACTLSNQGFEFIKVPLCSHPLLTTGAGDTFNAGFTASYLSGHSLYEQLAVAISASGFYVREGKAPYEKELYHFLNSWHNGELVTQ